MTVGLGWLDKEARLGRGVRGFVMGYKVHLVCDGEEDMPLAFTVAPANEKRYAIPLLREAAKRVKVKVVVCDKQYSTRKIREFVRALDAEPVIPYPKNQKKGIKGVLRVDNRFRIHGPERLRRLYRLKSSVERVNSRLSALLSRITLKGLKAAATQVSYAILGILFIAWTAIKTVRPEKTRSITYYV